VLEMVDRAGFNVQEGLFFRLLVPHFHFFWLETRSSGFMLSYVVTLLILYLFMLTCFCVHNTMNLHTKFDIGFCV
jgi:hypothetical protein